MDAFNGEDVTPHYMHACRLPEGKIPPEDLVSWIDVSNNAFHKGLWSLTNWMDEQIPAKVRKLLLVSREPMAGLRLCTFVKGVHSKRRRFNSDLQRIEHSCLAISGSTKRNRRDNYDSLLQFFVEEPSQEYNYSSGWVVASAIHLNRRWVPG
jgi:hypothetical protein